MGQRGRSIARGRTRRDNNEPDIVEALESMPGVTVVPLDSPSDLLVGRNGVNLLLEVKDPAKPPSSRALTPTQRKFFDAWKGQVDVVFTAAQAKALVLEKT